MRSTDSLDDCSSVLGRAERVRQLRRTLPKIVSAVLLKGLDNTPCIPHTLFRGPPPRGTHTERSHHSGRKLDPSRSVRLPVRRSRSLGPDPSLASSGACWSGGDGLRDLLLPGGQELLGQSGPRGSDDGLLGHAVSTRDGGSAHSLVQGSAIILLGTVGTTGPARNGLALLHSQP